MKNRNQFDSPYVHIQGCPIDDYLPFLDYENPVVDKRVNKKTYVAESFLLLYALLMGQEPIGYANVNNGDIFQDIHPWSKLAESQSQKALNSIFFHKDLANHFVRPDWVNILGLRSDPQNIIYTSFVRNKDILSFLSNDVIEALKLKEYHTPFDDLSTHDSVVELNEADIHKVLGRAEEYDISFFENRTVGLTARARNAVTELTKALHLLKQSLMVLPGSFIGSANNECLHNKEIHHIENIQTQKTRWLMKTVNVKSLGLHNQYFVQGSERIVNG